MNINDEIAGIKRSLIKKAKKKGIWENFGQKEIRKLQDKYTYTMCHNDPYHEIHRAVMSFEDWCISFNINDYKE